MPSFDELDKSLIKAYNEKKYEEAKSIARQIHHSVIPFQHMERIYFNLRKLYKDSYDIVIYGSHLHIDYIINYLISKGKRVIHIVPNNPTLPGTNPWKCLSTDIYNAKSSLHIDNFYKNEDSISWITSSVDFENIASKKFIFSSRELYEVCKRNYEPLQTISEIIIIPGIAVPEKNVIRRYGTLCYVGDEPEDIKFLTENISKVTESKGLFIYTDFKVPLPLPSKCFVLPKNKASFAKHDILLFPGMGKTEHFNTLYNNAMCNCCLPLGKPIKGFENIPSYTTENFAQVVNKYLIEGYKFDVSEMPVIDETIDELIKML